LKARQPPRFPETTNSATFGWRFLFPLAACFSSYNFLL